MPAYYNEIDPKAVAWLRELIKQGHIAPGEVDERSIEDVEPNELAKFTQCHFFAGIGVWSYALRQAGWDDEHPVWTGSCPCQPFSAAGKGGGFDDERHLWPAFFHLIKHGKRADVPVFGEQVASKDGLGWLDLVQSDMEGEGHAFGAVDTCAAGFGAPHIRQRLYWATNPLDHAPDARRDDAGKYHVGSPSLAPRPIESGHVSELDYAISAGLEGHAGHGDGEAGRTQSSGSIAASGNIGGMANTNSTERRADCAGGDDSNGKATKRHQGDSDAGKCGDVSELADAHGWNSGSEWEQRSGEQRQQSENSRFDPLADHTGDGCREECENGGRLLKRDNAEGITSGSGASGGNMRTGPTYGFWRAADWLHCRDGKWRPVEPGTFPLAHGASARVGRLRGYGNAINASQATAFIEAYISTIKQENV